MTEPRHTCADCGTPTDNFNLICDRCAPDYEDGAETIVSTGAHQTQRNSDPKQ